MVFKRTSIAQKTFMMASMPFIYVEVLERSPLFSTINLKDCVKDPTKQGASEKSLSETERPEIEFLC